MRQENLQPGKIDSHIIHMNGVAILVPGSGKNRRAGMEHYRNPIGLGRPVNDLQLLHAAQIFIGIKKLMRRMDFDQPNSQPQQLFHVSQNVAGMPRMQTAARNQSLPIFLTVVAINWLTPDVKPITSGAT